MDEESFKKDFLPVVCRKLLRSPETAIPSMFYRLSSSYCFAAFAIILKQIELNIGEIGADVTDPLINNLLASNSSTRKASVSSLVSIAKICKNHTLTNDIYSRVGVPFVSNN